MLYYVCRYINLCFFYISGRIYELDSKVDSQTSKVEELLGKSGSNEHQLGELKNDHEQIKSKTKLLFFYKTEKNHRFFNISLIGEQIALEKKMETIIEKMNELKTLLDSSK